MCVCVLRLFVLVGRSVSVGCKRPAERMTAVFDFLFDLMWFDIV